LEVLEAGERAGERKSRMVLDDLPLFRVTPAAPLPPSISRVEEHLSRIHPDELTPKEALQLIYELRALI
jgi:DNA mismatch repair protein MutS